MNDRNVVLEKEHRFGKGEIFLICCIIFQLIICLMPFHYGDGYFRDELYQIAMSNHLAWGYVDVPPLAPFMLHIVRFIFGTSLFSIHLLPALSGTIVIFLTYKMVRVFQGNSFALAFALIPVTFFCSIFGSIYIYDVFDLLFWNLMIICLLQLIKTDNKKWWIFFGVCAGFALLTKITVVFLGAGIVISMILTKERKNFKCVQFWFAGLIALLIFSPYLIWNACNGFPTLEFFGNYTHGKLVHMSILFYLKEQVIIMLPAFPVWFLGLCYLLFAKKERNVKFFGIVFIIIFVLCVYKQTRPNLLLPYYTVLLAAGGVLLESILRSRLFLWFKGIYLVFMIGVLLYILPNYRPILPVNFYIKYYGNKGTNLEGQKKGILPQFLADRFGWKDLAEKVAKIYNSLPPEQRKKTVIFTENYGEAGAIALFGKKYDLPSPISGHNQYFLWGPKDYTGESMIIVQGNSLEHYKKLFNNVKLVARTNNKYCMPYENNLPIWLCTEPKFKSLKGIWSEVKGYN